LTPYILLGRKKLPPECAPSPEHVYDEHWQIWIHKNSGMPLVCCLRTHAQPTQFGETTITATREGVDQTEGAALQVSEFGETIQTRTHEGMDQTEGTALQASQLGETTLTKTREVVDQTEGATLQEFDAPYSHF